LEISNALAVLLKNPAFLPDGGILGFGFGHKYPFSQASTRLSDLKDSLKGIDAALKRACDSLPLSTAVKAVYRNDSDAVLLDHFADFGDQEIEQQMVDYLKEYDNGQVVYTYLWGGTSKAALLQR
jgi:predicted phosphohydrolase